MNHPKQNSAQSKIRAGIAAKVRRLDATETGRIFLNVDELNRKSQQQQRMSRYVE